MRLVKFIMLFMIIVIVLVVLPVETHAQCTDSTGATVPCPSGGSGSTTDGDTGTTEEPTGVDPVPSSADEPVSPDRDGDGTIDVADLCPDEGGPDWNRGCPESVNINPETDAELSPESPDSSLPALPQSSCMVGTQGVIVNIRSAPRVDAEIANRMAADAVLPVSYRVFDTDGEWFRVDSGFVFGDVVRQNDACQQLPAFSRGAVESNFDLTSVSPECFVNLRSQWRDQGAPILPAPSYAESPTARLPVEQFPARVDEELANEDGQWYRVGSGYIPLEYVSPDNGCELEERYQYSPPYNNVGFSAGTCRLVGKPDVDQIEGFANPLFDEILYFWPSDVHLDVIDMVVVDGEIWYVVDDPLNPGNNVYVSADAVNLLGSCTGIVKCTWAPNGGSATAVSSPNAALLDGNDAVLIGSGAFEVLETIVQQDGVWYKFKGPNDEILYVQADEAELFGPCAGVVGCMLTVPDGVSEVIAADMPSNAALNGDNILGFSPPTIFNVLETVFTPDGAWYKFYAEGLGYYYVPVDDVAVQGDCNIAGKCAISPNGGGELTSAASEPSLNALENPVVLLPENSHLEVLGTVLNGQGLWYEVKGTPPDDPLYVLAQDVDLVGYCEGVATCHVSPLPDSPPLVANPEPVEPEPPMPEDFVILLQDDNILPIINAVSNQYGDWYQVQIDFPTDELSNGIVYLPATQTESIGECP